MCGMEVGKTAGWSRPGYLIAPAGFVERLPFLTELPWHLCQILLGHKHEALYPDCTPLIFIYLLTKSTLS